MAKISASASMGVKLKFFSDFENVNPHFSISIERNVPDEWTDQQCADYAADLLTAARARVEEKIEADIKSAKGDKIKLKKEN